MSKSYPIFNSWYQANDDFNRIVKQDKRLEKRYLKKAKQVIITATILILVLIVILILIGYKIGTLLEMINN